MTTIQRQIITSLYNRCLHTLGTLEYHEQESDTEEEYSLYTQDEQYICEFTFDHDEGKPGLLISEPFGTKELIDISNPNYEKEVLIFIHKRLKALNRTSFDD